jgi:hypothetical protein
MSLIIAPTQDDIDLTVGYRITRWHEYKNYECVYCQYATLWLDKMKKHQAEDNHAWPYPGQNQPDVAETDKDKEPSYG